MEEQRYDVVVWGGGLGGTCAALQAARSGVRVVLLLSGSWCGGMLTAAGVSAPDGHELSAWHTGLWGAFLRAMAHREPGGLDHNWVSCFGFRPDRAEALLQGWLAAEDRLRVLPQAQLQHLRRSDGRIRWLEVSCGEAALRLHGTLFIDGSDLGDLVAAAAAPFRLGWEARSCWQEPSAPTATQLRDDPFFRQQPVQSPTWVAMATVPAGNLKATPPLTPPFQHATTGYGLERLLRYGQLPDGLCMLNWPQDGNDYHRNLLRAFGSAAERRALAQEMRQHSLKFLRAVIAAADGAVAPAALFPTATATPDCLALAPYWREGRRMEGVATLSENDVLPGPAGHGAIPRCADGTCLTVAIGNYPNDHHYPHRPPAPWRPAPKQHLWGGRLSGTPFAVPWGVLPSADCPNLLAADKAVSVSHVANGTTRLQPMVMNLGQVAGLAAALAVCRRCDPVDVPVGELQEALLTDPVAPAGLLPDPALAWHAADWLQQQRRGLQALHSGCPLPPVTPQPLPRRWLSRHGQPRHGTVHGDGQRWWHHSGGSRVPLITLEPHVAACFDRWVDGQRVELLGCLNPHGPWFRVEQVLH